MTPAAAEAGAAGPGWRRTRRIVAGLLAAGLVFVAVREVRSPGDYLGFVAFGRAALDGILPYSRALELAYRPGVAAAWATWPPAFAPFAVLLAWLDGLARPLGVLVLQGLGLAGLAVALAYFVRRLTGRRLSSSLASVPVLLALLVPYRILLNSLQNTQVNLLVLGLVAGAYGLFGAHRPEGGGEGSRPRRSRVWAGGAALGAATALKAAPLLVLGHLAWRGRWRELAAGLGGVAAWWVVLPAVLVGPSALVSSYGAWLAHATSGTLLTRGANQSLLAALGRLVPGPAGTAAFVAAAVLLAAAALVVFGRPGRPAGPAREARELAVVLLATSLLSPLAWKAHFVTLVPIVLVLAVPAGAAGSTGAAAPVGPEAAYGGPRRAVLLERAALLVAFLVLDLTGRSLIGHAAAAALERADFLTWTALGLGLVALYRLAREAPTRVLAESGLGEARGKRV